MFVGRLSRHYLFSKVEFFLSFGEENRDKKSWETEVNWGVHEWAQARAVCGCSMAISHLSYTLAFGTFKHSFLYV